MKLLPNPMLMLLLGVSDKQDKTSYSLNKHLKINSDKI